MIAEIVTEMAKYRGRSFDREAMGAAFGRAALIDREFGPDFTTYMGKSKHASPTQRRMWAPIAFGYLERGADAVSRGWKRT